MKKSVLSLAVLAALSTTGSAFAQSNVQVYGLIDGGVEYLNHASATQDHLIRVVSGGKNTSRWGLRGTEELGGGLKAVFGLEGGIMIDTGAADGPLFKRQAYVGLDGSYGRVVIGRSFTTTYDFVIQYDPLGYAPNYSWATSSNATGPSKYGMTTAFDNLIKYSGSTGNFKYGATVGLGEQNGSTADSRKYAVAASWSQGGLGVMGAFEQINGNTLVANGERDKTRAFHVAANYNTGDWRAYAGMRGYKQDRALLGAADVRGDTYWVGASYLIQPAITLTGAVYHVNVKNVASNVDADPTMYVARGLYALSKRTDLYVAAAYAKARNNQLVSLSRDDAGFANSQTGITAGIQHRF